jgi:hypothetical protein
MNRILFSIDLLSMWVGKSFGWLILVLTLGTSYEVFVRYILVAPTTWAFDFSYITYGGLFLMAGAYTLSRNGHVRGDVIYRLWPQRMQAVIDLTLSGRPGVPAQDADPGHRRLALHPRHRRGRALHHLHPPGLLAAAPARRRGNGDRNPA